MLRKHRSALLILVAVTTALIAGCGEKSSTSRKSQKSLTVFAASSLTEPLQKIEPNATYQFASSETLATHIAEGAEVDVFVSADAAISDRLSEEGLVRRAVPIATNHVVLAVAEGLQIKSFDEFLQDDDVRFVIATETAPLGAYTNKVLSELGHDDLIDRAVSREPDAKSVTAKILLGEAEAGFVYSTDAKVSAGKLKVVELPKADSNHVVYTISIVKSTEHATAAESFIDDVTSAQGRKILKSAGFGLP